MCVITYNLRPTGIESARRRLLCGSKSRGRSVAATYRPRSSRRLEGTGWREGDGRYARVTARAGRAMRAHFVRVPGTSDVGPAALWGARFVRFVLARERDLVRSRHNATIADMSCFPLRFKGNETIFRRRPLFLFFCGHSAPIGMHAFFLSRGFAISLSARLRSVTEKRKNGTMSENRRVSFQRQARLFNQFVVFSSFFVTEKRKLMFRHNRAYFGTDNYKGAKRY